MALECPSGVEIIEHYSDYFKLKLEKTRNDDESIGKLFGLVEKCKEAMDLISEYSVSQTTMEQIFQNFANQDNDEKDEKSQEKAKNLKLMFCLSTNELIADNGHHSLRKIT